MVRARWSLVLAGRPELATAYSLESTLDELIFVIGPLIATLIATHASPVLVLYVAMGLVVIGALWFSSQHATEPAAHPVGAARPASALRARGMLLLTLATMFMGTVFASAEITMVAFCGQHGERGTSGLVVALFAGGSGVSGFVYGSRRWRADVLWRYRLQASIFGVLPLLFLVPTGVPMLAGCAFVVGLATAPTLITTFGLVERVVPGASLTEGLSWMLTGLNLGYGAGASVVGSIADGHGARVAFTVTIGSALATAAMAWAVHRRLSAPDGSRRTQVGPSEHAALS